MDCPECGRALLLIFHEWRSRDSIVVFEYHHTDDARAEAEGRGKKLCVVTVPYHEGIERYKREWDTMQSMFADRIIERFTRAT